MADIVTGTVTGQVDDTSMLEQFAATRQEIAQDTCATIDAVKTTGWATADRVGVEADRIVAQDTAYFIAGQQNAFSNAQAVAALKASVDMSFANTLNAINTQGQLAAAAAELSASKNAAATALAAANTNQLIVADGNATRALINSLNNDELNRRLIERNTELVECRGDNRYWQGQFNNAQQANLVSQINSLNSQFAETRQGMVNFGTMAGVGQSSTSNNVR